MRVTSGRRSRPAASSLGRRRLRIAAIRGAKPSMSKTLKSAVMKPRNGMLSLLAADQGYAVSGSRGKMGRRIRLKSKRARLDEDSPGASTSTISRAMGSKAAR